MAPNASATETLGTDSLADNDNPTDRRPVPFMYIDAAHGIKKSQQTAEDARREEHVHAGTG